jgi:hypothetical protein
MSHGTLTFADAKPILAHILSIQEGRRIMTNDITIDDFTNMIHTINGNIHAFDMEIGWTYPQSAVSRTPDDAIYALVNLSSDPQTQLATTHSPDEIAYVRRVLDGIFETNNTKGREIMAIRGIDAINLSKPRGGRDSAVGINGTQTESQAAANTALTKERAEKVLGSLVQEGWFERSRAGYYTLSPRGLIELKGWLVETYNEEEDEADEDGLLWQRIKTCNACREIVTVGQRCADVDCTCRFHEFCATSFFNNQRDRKCPVCKTEWGTSNYVGEKAASGPRMGGNMSAGASSRQSKPASRRQTRMEVDEEDEEDGSEDE